MEFVRQKRRGKAVEAADGRCEFMERSKAGETTKSGGL